jgi:hypothetical protein
MRHLRQFVVLGIILSLPLRAFAQSPVADGLRKNAAFYHENLVAAAETMGADKYFFKPTRAQMTFGEIVVHLIRANDLMCASLGGVAVPTPPKVAATDAKSVLVGQLRDSFTFCDRAIARMDDSRMDEQLPFFEGSRASRASIMMDTATDWADHYSQFAIYLRLSGLVPPTARAKEH